MVEGVGAARNTAKFMGESDFYGHYYYLSVLSKGNKYVIKLLQFLINFAGYLAVFVEVTISRKKNENIQKFIITESLKLQQEYIYI